MVIKKDRDFVIDNSVGRTFRKYNIIEYKNPADALNIDVVWKCIGYAGMQDYLTELMSDKFEEAIQGERKTIIENMLRKGKTPEEISSLTGLALEDVQKVQDAMMQPA